jgi:ComF family protein
MAQHFKEFDTKPDALIAVPLHTKRLRERGFNQSNEITHYLHDALAIPQYHHSIKRIINTASQASLNAVGRRKNIKGAFEFTIPEGIQSVAIIDDVVTTGSTANEIARTLKKAGVKRVEIWAFARA